MGYHLGRGDGNAAKRSAWIVIHFITAVNIVMALLFLPLGREILRFATDDSDVLGMAATLVPAMLVGTYLNLIVGNVTSGVFSGQGRPLIATILSFGLELPMSIGGVAIYILVFHGDLLGVYWWGAISGGLEALIVLYLMIVSKWDKCAEEALERQETARVEGNDDDDEEEGPEDGVAGSTDLESSLAPTDDNSGEDDAAQPLLARA